VSSAVKVGDFDRSWPDPSAARAFARPKSSTLTTPSGVILMLEGLRSRHHPPRSQTLQHQDHARWGGQGTRLWSRKSPRGRRVRPGSVEVPDLDSGRDDIGIAAGSEEV